VGSGKASDDVDQTTKITNAVVNKTVLIMFLCSDSAWADMPTRSAEDIFDVLTTHFVSALAYYSPRISAIAGYTPCPGPAGALNQAGELVVDDVFRWHGEPRLVQFAMIFTSGLPQRFCIVVLSLYQAVRQDWNWDSAFEGPVLNLLYEEHPPVYPPDEDGQRTNDECYAALEIAMDDTGNVYFRFGVGPGSRATYFGYGDAELADQNRTRLAYVLQYQTAGVDEEYEAEFIVPWTETLIATCNLPPELDDMRIRPADAAPAIDAELCAAIEHGSRIAGAFVHNRDIVPTEDEDGNAVEVFSDAPDDDAEAEEDAEDFVAFVQGDFQDRFGASQYARAADTVARVSTAARRAHRTRRRNP
jgi:hypothetical protein